MRITKDNATLFQSKINFYIGNIDTTETVLIDSSFIVIGNIKTSKNILAEADLIVMGDIEAKSIYIFKDLLCTGKINTEICEVEGEFKVLEKNIFEKYMKAATIKIPKGHIDEVDKTKLNENDDKELWRNEKNIKYTRITKEIQLINGDIVIHNTLGEGKLISMSKNKIKIDFKIKGVREISKDITLKLGLLKKKTENIIDNTQRPNLSKEDMNNIDTLINYSNKNNRGINKNNENILRNKNASNINNTNNQHKNKSISFYIKDINSYVTEAMDNKGEIYEIHYIKYNNYTYIRLNQICDFLNINSNIIDNYISVPIKISYYGKGINGIKFINLNDVLDNKECIYKKLECYNYKYLQKYGTLLQILDYIRHDSDINLSNSIPYFRYVIDEILDNKKISIDELAKEWNVTVENIEFVRLGFTSNLSKFKQLIKNNKIVNLKENQYKIRETKWSDINICQ